MNALFTGSQGINLQVFIDDVCLATRTWDEHVLLLDKVLNIMQRVNLKLKGSKCLIAAKEISFLGHLVSSEGIRQCPKKLKALTELSQPSDVKAVRRVVGMYCVILLLGNNILQ